MQLILNGQNFQGAEFGISIMPEGDMDSIPLEDNKILNRDMGSCLWFED